MTERKSLRGRGKGSRGFTLVELLVVIAIIGILASLLTPVLIKVRQEGFKTDCKNNLRNIANAAQMYADDRKFYPFSKEVRGGAAPPELSSDDDVRDSIELLYKYGYVDDPKVFLCKAAIDEEAEAYDTEAERKSQFNLEEHNCSFTWRKKITTVNEDSRTPITGDKRGGEESITNHKDGRHVAFKGSNVSWFENEKLEDPSNRETKRSRAELVGFDRIGRGQ